MNLIERVRITQKTIDQFLFRNFEWGTVDCAQLCDFHAKLAGHSTPLSKAGSYKTERGAKLALRKAGASNMEELVGLVLQPIAPAYAMVGDIVGLPGGSPEKPWTAIGVHVGEDKVIALANSTGLGDRVEWGPANLITHAWSIG